MLIVGVVLATGVLVWLNRAPQPPHTSVPDPLAISTDGAGFSTCPPNASWPTDLAWAPDGHHIAMIGFRQCGGPAGAIGNATGGGEFLALGVGGMLGVWDATSGKRTTTIELEQSVIAQVVPQPVRSDATLLQQVQIRYDTVLWSPDGKTIAVTFSAFTIRPNAHGALQTNTVIYGSGLLLVDWRAGTTRVLPQPSAPAPPPSYSLTGPIQAMQWNLHAGTARVVNLPQALAYQWQPDGTLAPTIPLPPAGSAPPALPSGRVGNPLGGQQFTIWQTGTMDYAQECGAARSCCPVIDELAATFGTSAAWSPDGRYLLLPVVSALGAQTLSVQGKMPAPVIKAVPGACQLGTFAPHDVPLPPHDPALRAAMESLSPSPLSPLGLPQSSVPTQGQVAWSPDGHYLAVQRSVTSSDPNRAVLTIYSTATGQAVGTITQGASLAFMPHATGNNSPFVQADTFLWSADSRHLLALDTASKVIIVFGPNSLGLR